MRVLVTNKYVSNYIKLSQAANATVGVYARYTDFGGYISSAVMASEHPEAVNDSFWPDYYSSDNNSSDFKTVLLKNVPIDIANGLILQGTQSQRYADGYVAADIARPYNTQK